MDNTIIIPTYNNIQMLKDCLKSVMTMTDLSRSEILVVANGCRDGTEDHVRGLGNVGLLSFPEPMGFTGATNEGIRTSSARRVILLNDDCVILDWGGEQRVGRNARSPIQGRPANSRHGLV